MATAATVLGHLVTRIPGAHPGAAIPRRATVVIAVAVARTAIGERMAREIAALRRARGRRGAPVAVRAGGSAPTLPERGRRRP